jgi:thiol peroxidase
MARITFKGNPVDTAGDLPKQGTRAPDFKLVDTNLAEVTLASYAGKKKVLNIFPSVDTGVCATSVREFNKRAAQKGDTVVINISADLPFAHKRFCGAEGIQNVVSASTFRSGFAKDYGVEMKNGPLAGLCSRAVVVLNQENQVVYAEQVPEIAQEPNYDQAMAAL